MNNGMPKFRIEVCSHFTGWWRTVLYADNLMEAVIKLNSAYNFGYPAGRIKLITSY